jgi:dolichol kinase
VAGSHSEPARKIVHILVGTAAVLLKFLTWWQAALLAAAAIVMNAFVLPRFMPSLSRPDAAGRPDEGIVLYPVAVLGLILAFPRNLEIVAIAWVVLACGDGFATLIGAHVPSPPLSWNPGKSVLGLAAFVLFGGAASVGIAAWMTFGRADVPAWWIVAAPLAATIAAALVETTTIRLNDNLTVTATAALVVAAVSGIDDATWRQAWPAAIARMPAALALNGLASSAGWLAGTVTIPGAIVGAAIGIAVFAGLGWPGWLMLFAAFLAAAISTRLGRAQKARAGIAESRGGRRGPGNAIANTGLAACLAVLALGAQHRELVLIAFCASLITSASDTVASEIERPGERRPGS